MPQKMIKKTKIPQHIAIIMDGNGRWAKLKNLPKIAGHRAGAIAVEKIIKDCVDLGIKVLTLYAFSTENWKRSKLEISGLMKLLDWYLKLNTNKLKKNRVRLMVSGDVLKLPKSLQKELKKVAKETREGSKLIVNLALNYGGREEIVQAAKRIALEVKQGKLGIDDINEKVFANKLYTKDLPDPDLLIRTSDEKRISNFLLWQLSYSELYFTSTLWPDFKRKDLIEAIEDYKRRERRFGARLT